MKKKHTSKDIANILGISRGTVDRALNNRGRINPETKKKVLKVADELGYKPNSLARTLVLQRNIRIASILPAVPEYFFSKIEDGIKDAERALKDFGVNVSYYNIKTLNDAVTQIELIEQLKEKNYDGILIIPADAKLITPHIQSFAKEDVPVVTINNDVPEGKRLCFVGENSTRAGRVAAELMAKFTGFKGKVAIMTGFTKASSIYDRAEGFISFMKQHKDINVLGPFEYFEDVKEAYEIAKRLSIDHDDLSGIFLTTTTGLESAAKAIVDAGKKTDVKIIGFDTSPQIKDMIRNDVIFATIYQDQQAQGYYGLRILANYIMNGKMPENEFMYTRLGIILKENLHDGDYPLYKLNNKL